MVVLVFLMLEKVGTSGRSRPIGRVPWGQKNAAALWGGGVEERCKGGMRCVGAACSLTAWWDPAAG